MKSEKSHDCGILIDRFEALTREHERMMSGLSMMTKKKVEEYFSLKWELKKLLSLACSNDFGSSSDE